MNCIGCSLPGYLLPNGQRPCAQCCGDPSFRIQAVEEVCSYCHRSVAECICDELAAEYEREMAEAMCSYCGQWLEDCICDDLAAQYVRLQSDIARTRKERER